MHYDDPMPMDNKNDRTICSTSSSSVRAYVPFSARRACTRILMMSRLASVSSLTVISASDIFSARISREIRRISYVEAISVVQGAAYKRKNSAFVRQERVRDAHLEVVKTETSVGGDSPTRT